MHVLCQYGITVAQFYMRFGRAIVGPVEIGCQLAENSNGFQRNEVSDIIPPTEQV